MHRVGLWVGLVLCALGCLLSGCDTDRKGPKKTLAEREAERYAETSSKTLDAYQDVFERVANNIRDDTYEHKPCPTELSQTLDNGVWLNASTIALTESALRWFVETPRERTSSAEAPAPWSLGAEGYLNDFGLAAPDVAGPDGGRLAVLRKARMFERYGSADDRTVGLLSNDFIHRFDSEHRKAPQHVLLLRSVELVEPKAPSEIARTKDELKVDELGRDLQARKDPSEITSAFEEPPAHSETSFVGGRLRGVLEVYEASSGERLCGHAVSAKNSDAIESYYKGAQAVHDDLADSFVTAANQAFSAPLRKVHAPHETSP
ncbi:MAG: hypothetical protein K0V04_42380 [Deltaproteobacteria bacterium]|nr:hypothetical protein [Deltaproteobacteria bacterium]